MNGILIMDKPAGFTSHDVVAKLRGICGTRRIGHSGTLDPMATGVLPVFIGRATRACEFAEGDDKVYRATLTLGVTTTTQDSSGTVLSESPVLCDLTDVRAAASGFLGEIEQIPPMYSAIKVGGKKLYELARSGVEIERKARKITVYSIDVTQLGTREYSLLIHCSKGTYVRTLCADIGASLGCGGMMSALRRIRAGRFDESMAHGFDEVSDNPTAHLLPVDSLFSHFPKVTLSPSGERKCKNGALVPCKTAELGARYRVYSESGEFLMLAEGIDGNLKTVKSFFEV
ncbi:MAG: tRNA pseudouridine(55) synthase TruB [Oscillospiraceae bacterium]|nr:tRNA pseudouridine(55) synthase TruB [Oscillospiraceae bacterium]